jgi:hypothetical protein
MLKGLLYTSELFYSLLLHCYPAQHRQDYGVLMMQTFRDMCRATYIKHGGLGLIQVWIVVLTDFSVSVLVERTAAIGKGHLMSKKTWLTLALAVVFSVFTGYVNMTASEVQAPMACILVCSFLTGLIQPKGAWRWAVLIGLSICLSTFFGLAINYKMVDVPRFPITLIVLIAPALVAAYIGAATNHVILSTRRQSV